MFVSNVDMVCYTSFSTESAYETSRADDEFSYFTEKKNHALHYMLIVCLADVSHVIASIFFFFLKKKRKKCFENVLC